MAEDEKTKKRVLWVTYINIVLYALSYQLQRPVEPYLIQSLVEKENNNNNGLTKSSTNSINQTYGNLQSFFSLCQMFGSPLVGILLDRIGIRKTSCIVFLASAISYAILASATNLTLLFVSKIPTVLQAAFLCAQATAATTMGENASLRAAALGRMTTAYTIGATIGPILGGYLAANGDFYFSAKVAVVGSLLSALLSLLFLPDNNNNCNDDNDDDTTMLRNKDKSVTVAPATGTNEKKKRNLRDDIHHTIEIATRHDIWPLLMVKIIGGVCASMHSTSLPLILTQTLHLEPQQLGLVMSCGMFAVAVFGAFAMGIMNRILGSFGMMNTGLLARSISGLTVAGVVVVYSTDIAPVTTEFILMQVIVVSIVHQLSQHILATGLTTLTTGSVNQDEQGSLLGIEHSLFSLSRTFGPFLGTIILEYGGIFPVEMTCGSLDVLSVLLLSLTLPHLSKRKST